VNGIEKVFTQKAVNRIFKHIPVKTLRWWGMMALYGHIAIAWDARGVHRTYEVGNLYQIGIVAELSSLNIPTRNISQAMIKNFRYGMNMVVPVGTNVSECPEINVSTQMDKYLIMTKVSYEFSIKGKDRKIHDWDSFVINKARISLDKLFKGSGVEKGRLETYTISTLMVIDLAEIKKEVDALIAK